MDPSLVPLANPIAQNAYAQFGAFMLLAAAGWIMWWVQRRETRDARTELGGAREAFEKQMAAARIAFETQLKEAREELGDMHRAMVATVEKNSTAMSVLAERLRGAA